MIPNAAKIQKDLRAGNNWKRDSSCHKMHWFATFLKYNMTSHKNFHVTNLPTSDSKKIDDDWSKQNLLYYSVKFLKNYNCIVVCEVQILACQFLNILNHKIIRILWQRFAFQGENFDKIGQEITVVICLKHCGSHNKN